MALPTFYLTDFVGWTTTRWIPLSSIAINALQNLVANTPSLTPYADSLVGLNTPANSVTFLPSLNAIASDQNFIDAAGVMVLAPTLLILLQYISFTDETLTQQNINDMFTVIAKTPQFSKYSDQLSGITPDNFMDYIDVISTLCMLPKFEIDVVEYAANAIKT